MRGKCADVNGDGKLDVLVQNFYASTSCTAGPLGVLLGNRNEFVLTMLAAAALAQAQQSQADFYKGKPRQDGVRRDHRLHITKDLSSEAVARSAARERSART